MNIERVFTDRLRDTWIEAGHKSNLDGLTFSTFTDRPTKRVKIQWNLQIKDVLGL